MAIIDYHSIKSLVFANLTKSSRILIPVLSCLCDDWDGSLSPEHSKHHILALYSGLAIRSVQTALQELQKKDIISIDTQSGRPASIQYIPVAKLSAKTQKGRQPLPTSQLNLGNSCRPRLEKIPPQTPVDKEPVSVGTHLAPNDSPKINEQQPKIVALADQIGDTLVELKISEKGGAFVVSVLKAMSGRNGEIDDPPAYFVSCCDRGIIPWTKRQKAEAKAATLREEKLLYEEAREELQEQHKLMVLREHADPDAQARIKATQDAFWENMGDYRPPAEITNYAQEHDYPG